MTAPEASGRRGNVEAGGGPKWPARFFARLDPMSPDLILYTRAGCHLCEDAAAILAELGVAYTPVDVDTDADLQARHGWDVPVLARGGQVLVKGVFGRARVRAALGLD